MSNDIPFPPPKSSRPFFWMFIGIGLLRVGRPRRLWLRGLCGFFSRAFTFVHTLITSKLRPSPRLWVVLNTENEAGRYAQKATVRSVRTQTYGNWRFLQNGDVLSPEDYVLPLTAGDTLYDSAFAELVNCHRANPAAEVIFGDHAWTDGVELLQPCYKPDWNPEAFSGSGNVLYGPVLFKAGCWNLAEAKPVLPKTPSSFSSCRHVLMNRLSPFSETSWCVPTAPAIPSTDKPRVAVVIPTKDRLPLLKCCIESIKKFTTYCPYEIIIVDNGSQEPETHDFLAGCGCRVIRHDPEFNYSELNNTGARATDAPLLLFLNNDIEVPADHGDWMTTLVETIERQDVGIVGPLLKYPCGAIQHGGVGVMMNRYGKFMLRNLFAGQMDVNSWALRERECSGVTGACMMVRRDVFDRLKGFEEKMPVVFNDVDFCLRARAANFRILYTPHVQLIHHEGVSRIGASPRHRDIKSAYRLLHDRFAATFPRDPFARQEWGRR